MYHPVSLVGGVPTELPEEEYIELRNLTASSVPLFDTLFPTNTWSVKNAVDFRFATNTTIATNGYLLLVAFDPATNALALASFRTKYSVSASVPIYGPFNKRLGNSGDSVELYRPDTVQMPPHPDAGFVPQILVDRVQYGFAPPWSTNADGGGASLQRRVGVEYGNDPVNWEGKAPTAGIANGPETGTIPMITAPPASQTVDPGSNVVLTMTVTGTPPFAYQWRLDGINIAGATNATLNIACSQRASAGVYTVIVANGAGSVTSAPATLAVNPPLAPVLIHPSLKGTNFTLTLPTQNCVTYIVECKDSFAAPSWTTLATLFGNGAPMTVTNLSASVARRFYRVRAP